MIQKLSFSVNPEVLLGFLPNCDAPCKRVANIGNPNDLRP